MVRLRLLGLSLASLALFGARPLAAAPVSLTGHVETDFSASNPDVRIVPVSSNPLGIGQAAFMTNNGWVSGWSIKDIRVAYDSTTDTLSVGFNTFKNAAGVQSIVGDSDGNGNPATASPGMLAAGGLESPHLGGQKSVAFAIAPDGPKGPISPGTPVLIAGVPGDKSAAGPGLDGFTVSSYKNNTLGLSLNFGSLLPSNLGALAFDPSAAHPGFEFTVKNVSKLPGIDPTKGFWVVGYAGSPADNVAGESASAYTRLAPFAPQEIPEPATVMTWALVAGGMALRLRRVRRETGQR